MDNFPMSQEKIALLLDFIFAPRQGERLLFLTDYPQGAADSKRLGRQALLSRWYSAASLLSKKKGFILLPLVKYPETGKNNADLPTTAVTQGGGHVDKLPELISSSNMVVAMTEYSATAPLRNIASRASSLRVISMPGITSDMEGAMSADYTRIAERGRKLLAVVGASSGFEILFSGSSLPSNTKLYIDTRANNWLLESGMCRQAGEFINFPSGELFTPPYEGVSPEGRREFGDSQTHGVLPVFSHTDSKIAFLHIDKNRIVRVQGDSDAANKIIDDIANDENAANIAELGFGLNDKARSDFRVPVLEREKSGPHIAYGRNDHFGTPTSLSGKVRANIHQDIVYSQNSPIAATIHAVYKNGNRVLICERGKLVAV